MKLPEFSSDFHKLKEAKPVDLVKKGYDIAYSAAATQSSWSKEWEAFRNKGDTKVLQKYCSSHVIERCKTEHKAFAAHRVFYSLSATSPFSTISSTDNHQHIINLNSKDELLKPYTVTPPIKPWPRKLTSKRLCSIISQQQNLDLALEIFHYAGDYHPNFHHNYDTYHSIIHKLSRHRSFEPIPSLLNDLRRSQIDCGENLFITLIQQTKRGDKSIPSNQLFRNK